MNGPKKNAPTRPFFGQKRSPLQVRLLAWKVVGTSLVMVRQYWIEWVFRLVRWVGWWTLLDFCGQEQFIIPSFPSNKPAELYTWFNSTFCKFLHGLVKCFCWSSMFWLKWAKKSVLFFLQKITCSTEQRGFPNMKGMVLHQSFRRHFFFVFYQQRKSDRTWRDARTELTGRGEAKDGGNRWDRTTGRNLVDGDPLIEVSAPYRWSALQLGAWRLSRCLLGMKQKCLQPASFPPKKSRVVSAKWGTFFLRAAVRENPNWVE